MPEIPTQREDIRQLAGVHLFHFAFSNCSQRVRFALAEKDVSWTSHAINLPKEEHLTPEFRALNPKGVVPVLVHDGRTIIESNDIIGYIDVHFDGLWLEPEADDDPAFGEDLIRRASNIQAALKLLSHEFLFKMGRRMNADQLAAFEAKGPSPELLQFMRDFCSPQGFGETRIKAAAAEFDESFTVLEARLSNADWLSGPRFGLADISWAGNVHRMALMRWPLEKTPALRDWYRRIKVRPSFKKAVLGHEPVAIRTAFKTYSLARAAQRTSITDYL
jgi:glutathione S-transferase